MVRYQAEFITTLARDYNASVFNASLTQVLIASGCDDFAPVYPLDRSVYIEAIRFDCSALQRDVYAQTTLDLLTVSLRQGGFFTLNESQVTLITPVDNLQQVVIIWFAVQTAFLILMVLMFVNPIREGLYSKITQIIVQ